MSRGGYPHVSKCQSEGNTSKFARFSVQRDSMERTVELRRAGKTRKTIKQISKVNKEINKYQNRTMLMSKSTELERL